MSQFLHNNDDAKAIAIPQVFSKNSRANKTNSIAKLCRFVKLVLQPDAFLNNFNLRTKISCKRSLVKWAQVTSPEKTRAISKCDEYPDNSSMSRNNSLSQKDSDWGKMY